jgi:hypothetical protein
MKPSAFVLCVLVSSGAIPVFAAETSPAAPAAATPLPQENAEVARLFAEDQADRKPKDGQPIDWKVVGPRDAARQKRIMALYREGRLQTGKDLFHAGMILQHGDKPEDYLLCHELCVAAVFKSGRSEKASWLGTAKWLAAASHDRFLLSIGRAQRFGTQFSSTGRNGPRRLDRLEEGVSDELRKAWSVPSLAEAKAREKEMNQPKK